MKTRMTVPVASALLLVGAALAACQSASQGEKLSAAQLRSDMPNTTATSTKGNWVVYNGANGAATIKMAGKTDSGAYRVSDDGLWCLKFKSAFAGRELCDQIYKEGSVYRSVHRDGTEDTWTLTPGTTGM